MSPHPAIVAGRVAVVSGAASGIGRAAATRFAALGMRVVLLDIDASGVLAAVEAIREAGGQAIALVMDVSERADWERALQTASAFGEVSVLMNNAGREAGPGTAGAAGALFAHPSTWEKTLGVNLWGPVYGTQVFGPLFLSAAYPVAVINTGSKQGITQPPGDSAYNVSKAGLKALTECTSHELRTATGGRASAHLLIPGFTFTGFQRARGVTEKPAGAWTPEQVVEYMLEGLAAGDFYILCPDNEVTRAIDIKRMRWSAGDIIEGRPALSRWHPDHAAAFAAHMASDT